ncbi:MAG: dihydroneopterin aldolase [Gemmatimonadota bacterium]
MTTDDLILIRDLRVRGIIGINDWERKNPQDILISLEIVVDARLAGLTDDMDDSLNYRTIAKDIIAYVESSEHFLVEALATEIARIVTIGHGASRVMVRVEKPGALRFAESVGIEIERTPDDFD